MSTLLQHTKNLSRPVRIVVAPADRMAIIRRTFGAWKRPIKQSTRELASIRRTLDRKLPSYGNA